MSDHWRNFGEGELHVIGSLLPALGESAPAQRCPSCGERCLRWYHYRNPHREQSKISYVWCSSCRTYYGQTTFQERWDLLDPLDDAPQLRALETSDLNKYFLELDRLWDAGKLPQVRDERRGRRR